MAVDHLMGDDPGLEDPPAFLIAAGVSLALAGGLFAGVVPRSRDAAGIELAARRAMMCSVLAVLALPLVWLGVPFVLAGGGVALGLLARADERSRRATLAIALGAFVVAACTVGYAVTAATKLS